MLKELDLAQALFGLFQSFVGSAEIFPLVETTLYPPFTFTIIGSRLPSDFPPGPAYERIITLDLGWVARPFGFHRIISAPPSYTIPVCPL